MSNVQLNVGSGGAFVATNSVTRDTVTEVMELINIADPVSAACATVDSNGLHVNINGALPAGSALIGGVEVYDSAGTNKLAVDATGKIGVNNFPATQPISGTVAVSAIAGALPGGTNNIGNVTLAGCKYLLITDTTAHNNIASAVALVGIMNLDSAAQTNELLVNDSATAGSGTQIGPTGALGAGQLVIYPLGGLLLQTGLSAQFQTANPTGAGILLMYR